LDNGTFLLTITDMTTGENFQTTSAGTGAICDSAEWIAEAPVLNRRILPLAQFGPMVFHNASLTIDGVSGGINHPGWEYLAIIMESRNGSIKATPSFLSPAGDNYRITWESS
jgi:hypothetical protein